VQIILYEDNVKVQSRDLFVAVLIVQFILFLGRQKVLIIASLIVSTLPTTFLLHTSLWS